MDMSEVFAKLKDLQSVLIRKNELESKISEAPNLLKNQEELLGRLKKEFLEKNESFEEVRSEVKRLKNELFEVDKKREHSEKCMESVETQRDYEILEKAISDARNEEERLRNVLSQENARYDKMNDEIKAAEQIISENEAEIETMKNSLDSERTAMTEEIKSLDAQKKKISNDLDSETIFKFERIIKNKKGDGIVAVKSGVCTGCNIILPAQFANEIQSETELKYCPYCSRVLYYEASDVELEDADEFTFDDSDMGGLADFDSAD